MRRVAQLASSCARSIGNWRLTLNQHCGVNFGINVRFKFPMPAAPSFYEAGPPEFLDLFQQLAKGSRR